MFATPARGYRVDNLREAFEESDLPFRVDLFVWDEIPKDFRKRIEAERVVLVEKKRRTRAQNSPAASSQTLPGPQEPRDCAEG